MIITRAQIKRLQSNNPTLNFPLVTDQLECVNECLAFFPYSLPEYNADRDACLANCYPKPDPNSETVQDPEHKKSGTNLLLPLGIGLALGAIALSQ